MDVRATRRTIYRSVALSHVAFLPTTQIVLHPRHLRQQAAAAAGDGVLTHPDNSNDESYREVGEQGGESAAEKHIIVQMATVVGTLILMQEFVTALNVIENPQKLASRFSLTQPGVMSASRVRCSGQQ